VLKVATRRPGAKEGGREEEEKRSGIATDSARRLRSNEKNTFAQTLEIVRSSRADFATNCVAAGRSGRDGVVTSIMQAFRDALFKRQAFDQF